MAQCKNAVTSVLTQSSYCSLALSHRFAKWWQFYSDLNVLTHWGRVMHICISKLTIIGSDNSLWPIRHQAIIWTNVGLLLIQTLGTNFSEILSEIHTFSLKKIHLKMLSAKWRLFHLGLIELIHQGWLLLHRPTDTKIKAIKEDFRSPVSQRSSL